MFQKIVSGGQTGADIAGLDWAIARNIPYGGWCPKGRMTEAGVLDARYHLVETLESGYLPRTERNVAEADGTVIFSLSPVLTGGSLRTKMFAKTHHKPCAHIHPGLPHPEDALRRFVDEQRIKVLNVAGPRGSKEPGVHAFVMRVLDAAFFFPEAAR